MQAAVGLHQAGRLGEAERAYRAILDRSPGNADAWHLLGVLLIQAGQPQHALEPVRRAIAIEPGRPQFHSTLGRTHFALSHAAEAIEPLRQAAALAPDASGAWCDLGTALQDVGDGEAAFDAYQRALALEPGNATARFNMAILRKDAGDLDGAITDLDTLLCAAPEAARVHTVIAGYLLEAGRIGDADRHCQQALSLSPQDLTAMSFSSVVALRRGDAQAARHWVDLDRLIHTERLAAPPAYADIGAFNDALEAHVLAHPTLENERAQNATRNGAHTDNLLRDGQTGPVGELAAQLDDAVRRYLAALPVQAQHPYLGRRPSAWRLQAWAVVMRSQGHQLAHTHPDGWVSGVYYPRVPDTVAEDDPAQAGWIEFGRPLPELLGGAAPQVRRIRPREGLLVLFPSYVYHETVPFEGSTHRISIAFDALPRW